MLALAVSTSYPTDNKPASIASVFFIFMVSLLQSTANKQF